MAEPPVIVLRADDYASIEELVAARQAVAAPVLYRVRSADAAAILEWLRPGDDVCLLDDPPQLVEHRIRAMQRRASPDVDPLTGLANRGAFVRGLATDLPAALLLLNLDHFKACNDRHGHLAGDEVLREAAARTRAALPADAEVGRVAGDAFAVALGPHHDARRVAAAIRAAFNAAPMYEDISVTASIGVVVRSTEATYEELLRRAEGALYSAKATGRNRIVDHADRVRAARERDGDVELDGFEDMTRVLAERVADVIAWRGRRVFQGLRELADVDALTGLYARRYLDRRLAFEVEQAHAQHVPLSVGLLDIDHFGRVNKDHGWPTGDKILADLAARVRDALRATDWAARYGGEELCIVLAGAKLDAARAVLERVRAAVDASPFATTQDAALPITASIGCAELGDGESLAQLVERASGQLLLAKGEGRNRVR